MSGATEIGIMGDDLAIGSDDYDPIVDNVDGEATEFGDGATGPVLNVGRSRGEAKRGARAWIGQHGDEVNTERPITGTLVEEVRNPVAP